MMMDLLQDVMRTRVPEPDMSTPRRRTKFDIPLEMSLMSVPGQPLTEPGELESRLYSSACLQPPAVGGRSQANFY